MNDLIIFKLKALVCLSDLAKQARTKTAGIDNQPDVL